MKKTNERIARWEFSAKHGHLLVMRILLIFIGKEMRERSMKLISNIEDICLRLLTIFYTVKRTVRNVLTIPTLALGMPSLRKDP